MNISKTIDKRNGKDGDDYKELSDYLKEKRTEKQLSIQDMENILGTNTRYRWFEGRPNQGMQLPTKKHYVIVKETLDLDNRFDKLIEREEAQRKVISRQKMTIGIGGNATRMGSEKIVDISETPQAKALDGSYAGYQPKPAVEVILVAMKPLSEKNYVEQAMSNSKGVTWLDDVRVPYRNDDDIPDTISAPDLRDVGKKSKEITGQDKLSFNTVSNAERVEYKTNTKGRFPANLLVSDDSLDIGKKTKNFRDKSTGNQYKEDKGINIYGKYNNETYTFNPPQDEGDFSRYYSLDAWEAQFIVTPKPSKSEKNKGLLGFMGKTVNDGRDTGMDTPYQRGETVRQNVHPTVKPVSLFKYLITMGSRPNDMILDPFMGSGTTAIACEKTARNWMGIELNPEFIHIAKKRLATLTNTRMESFIE